MDFGDIGSILGDLLGGPGGDLGGGADVVSPISDLGGTISEAGKSAADTASGFNFGDIASGIGGLAKGAGSAARGVLPFAQIGGAVLGGVNTYKGMEQMSQQNKLLKQAQQRQAEAAAPLTQFGKEELALAGKGQVSPAIQAQIDEWKAGAKQKIRDYLARSGMGDSSALVEWENHIEQQGEAMKAAALQDMQRQGVSSLSAGSQASTAAAGTSQQEQNALQQLIQQANEQLFRLGGLAA